MPGTVVSVSVRDGETVEAGEVLLSVEAMKMEHQLVAPLDGTVHISVGSGDLVKADQVVATVHPAATAAPPAAADAAEDAVEEAVILWARQSSRSATRFQTESDTRSGSNHSLPPTDQLLNKTRNTQHG